MAKTIRAEVEPRILRWARESVGLSMEEAAQKAGTAEERLVEWETDESDQRPSVAQARKLANIYKRSFATSVAIKLDLADPSRPLGQRLDQLGRHRLDERRRGRRRLGVTDDEAA